MRAKLGRKVGERIAHRAMRTAGRMPGSVQVAFSGKSRVVIDGQELDPGIQLLLAAAERRNDPPLDAVPVAAARAGFENRVRLTNGAPESVGGVRDLVVAGANGGLAARLYTPDEPSTSDETKPLLVYFHGGGFVFGSIESHDAPCRLICRHSGANVLSVEYGLAPEHPFPEPIEDAVAALRWATENAESLGSAPEFVAVGGDSAGAALSANASARLVAEGRAPLAQVLIYPVTNVSGTTRSRELFTEGFVLDRAVLDYFERQYAPNADGEDPRLSVSRTDPQVLAKMPPTVIVTAGFDPLRDEGEEYAQRLTGAGVPVALRRFPGLVHGFANFIGVNRTSRDAVIETGGMIRTLLDVSASRAGR